MDGLGELNKQDHHVAVGIGIGRLPVDPLVLRERPGESDVGDLLVDVPLITIDALGRLVIA